MDEKLDSAGMVHVENLDAPELSPQKKSLAADAAQSTAVEHSLTVRQAINAYPMALFWCFGVSMCVIMEGYDQILIGSLFAYPTFQRKYGKFAGFDDNGKEKYQLSAAWQAGLTNSSTAASVLGTALNGYLIDRFGHKKVLLSALLAMAAVIAITTFSPNIIVLCVGQFLAGFPWAIFATTAPAFASENLPMVLRSYLTSWTNMCFAIGQLIAAGVLRGFSTRTDEWGFRIPFAIQWAWIPIIAPIIYLSPASPWHEVRKGRIASAEKSLRRLQRASSDIDPKNTLAEIIKTNELEMELEVGTTYSDCFKGVELRRTEIACMCFVGQITSGSNFAYNSSYFFEQLGLSTTTVYNLTMGGLALALVGCIVNWVLCMPFFGRRTIYTWGMGAMTAALFIIGILNVWKHKTNIGYVQAGLCMFWTFVCGMSVGQLGWSMPAEVGSTRLRQKTVCVARNTYYLVNLVAGVIQPYMMNPTAWDLNGYTGFVWGGTAFVTLVWAYFRMPETKNRTYEELDLLFAWETPTRKFKTTAVNVMHEEHAAA